MLSKAVKQMIEDAKNCWVCGRFSWYLYRDGRCGNCCNVADRLASVSPREGTAN